MLLCDDSIINLCETEQLLTPFVRESVKTNENSEAHVSHGPSSFGYDVRLAEEFKVFTNVFPSTEIDPLDFDKRIFQGIKATENGGIAVNIDGASNIQEVDTEIKVDPRTGNKYILIPPGGFALGVTKERFKMPRNITGLVYNKSTYARCGINCYGTVIEAGWEGYLVLEFSNNTPLPARLYANQGAAQILFVQGDKDCRVSYADRGGKYQMQTGVQEPIV